MATPGVTSGGPDLEKIMRLSRTRTAALAPLAALLLLAGCSGDKPADPPASTAAAEDTKDGDDSKGGGKDDETTEPTEAAPGGSDGAACLVGEWSGDADEQITAMQEMMAASGVEATVALSGEVVSSFTADGQATSTYANQVMDITMAMEGQEIRSVTTMNGSTTGTYTATDTEITMTVTDASGLEYGMETYMGGTKVDAGLDGTTDELLKAMETTSTVGYTCSGDTLTMTTPNVSIGAPVESVLHRR